jgi:hypothetical protein
MKWLQENANWIFSGVGVVFLTGGGYIVKRLLGKDSLGQQQKADRGATAIQAGRDVQVGQNNKQKSS